MCQVLIILVVIVSGHHRAQANRLGFIPHPNQPGGNLRGHHGRQCGGLLYLEKQPCGKSQRIPGEPGIGRMVCGGLQRPVAAPFGRLDSFPRLPVSEREPPVRCLCATTLPWFGVEMETNFPRHAVPPQTSRITPPLPNGVSYLNLTNDRFYIWDM